MNLMLVCRLLIYRKIISAASDIVLKQREDVINVAKPNGRTIHRGLYPFLFKMTQKYWQELGGSNLQVAGRRL